MTRPVIGVVPSYLPADHTLSIREHYTDAITAAGGCPLILPLTPDPSVYETIFPLVDGFLLTGGSDIDPRRYGSDEVNDKIYDVTPNREEVECLILSYAYQFDIPTLGICRGMQMMNVFFGGTLYLDLADQFDGGGVRETTDGQDDIHHWQNVDYSLLTHFVDIVRASKLESVIQESMIFTNSMHHQGIRNLAPMLKAVAFGPDGLVEGVEVRERTYIIGVQWHPEFFSGERRMSCLFTSLVQEAAKTGSRKRADDASVIVTHCQSAMYAVF